MPSGQPIVPVDDPEVAPALRHGDIVALDGHDDGWLGTCHGGRNLRRGYGGSVLAHAIAAAAADAGPDRRLHSLHGYFLEPVDSRAPAWFRAEPVRDGRRYAVRQLAAEQSGRTVFTMTASFKTPEPDTFRRAARMPADVPGPENLPDGFGDRGKDSPIRSLMECREVPGEPDTRGPHEVSRRSWVRIQAPLGDDPVGHACGLAYLSDVTLAPTVFLRLQRRPERALLASLDHAMWFHHDARADDWLLFDQHSRIEGEGRTFARGELWTRTGELVASVAQEAMVSIRE